MQRMGSVLGIKPEAIAEYKRIHADVWPEVLAMIAACNIKNYTIFLKEPENLLFSYFEYHGTDFAADAATYGISLAVIGAAVRVRAWAALAKGASLTLMGLWVLGATAYHTLVLGVPRAEVMGVVGFLALLFDRRLTLASKADSQSPKTQPDATPAASSRQDER